MTQLVIIPTNDDTDRLDAYMRERFGNSAYCLPRGEWLVSYSGTSKQFCDETGITDGTLASAVVLSINGYYGHAPRAIWEWFALNQ